MPVCVADDSDRQLVLVRAFGFSLQASFDRTGLRRKEYPNVGRRQTRGRRYCGREVGRQAAARRLWTQRSQQLQVDNNRRLEARRDEVGNDIAEEST